MVVGSRVPGPYDVAMVRVVGAAFALPLSPAGEQPVRMRAVAPAIASAAVDLFNVESFIFFDGGRYLALASASLPRGGPARQCYMCCVVPTTIYAPNVAEIFNGGATKACGGARARCVARRASRSRSPTRR